MRREIKARLKSRGMISEFLSFAYLYLREYLEDVALLYTLLMHK